MSDHQKITTLLDKARTLAIEIDGLIDNALVGDVCHGRVYGHDRFDDGTEFRTSKIAAMGVIVSVGRFIETFSGSRYLVICHDDEALRLWEEKSKDITEKAKNYESRRKKQPTPIPDGVSFARIPS